MYEAAHAIARRGVQHAVALAGKDGSKVDFTIDFKLDIPTWGMAILAVTVVTYFILMHAIEYAFGRVVPALIMVESPESAIYIEALDSDETDATLKKEPELLLLKQKPITSSWRSVITHLRSRGGFWAPFRGFAMFSMNNVCLGFVSKAISLLPFIPQGTSTALGFILLANMNMAWTHIVISDPSPLPWFKRFPSTRLFKKIAGPSAIYAIVKQLSIVTPIALAWFYSARGANVDPSQMTGCQKKVMVLQAVSVVVLALAMSLFLVLPAKVVLTRIQASLLDDSQETIVPCDRSFGGKVVPEIVGGSGVLGVRDAWKTFTWSSRVRLVRAYVKVFTKQLAVTIFFFAIVAAELFLIVGKSELKKMIPSQ